MITLIQHFEADFLWKVSLKILNSGIILKTFTHDNTDLDTTQSCRGSQISLRWEFTKEL